MLQLEIVSPERLVVSEQVDYVGAPGVDGEFGVLPGHIPLLSALAIGALYYRKGKETTYVFISGGFAEVSNNTVTILTEAAELVADIDTARAVEAKRRAEERLVSKKEDLNTDRANFALKKAISRIKVRSRWAV